MGVPPHRGKTDRSGILHEAERIVDLDGRGSYFSYRLAGREGISEQRSSRGNRKLKMTVVPALRKEPRAGSPPGLSRRDKPGGSLATQGFGLLITLAATGYMQVHMHWGPRPSSVLGCAFLLFVSCNRPACRFFGETGVSRLLGHISFPLYLVHFAILVSFTSWATVTAYDAGALSQWVAVGISLASIILSVAAAFAFLPVEQLTQYVNERWARSILR